MKIKQFYYKGFPVWMSGNRVYSPSHDEFPGLDIESPEYRAVYYCIEEGSIEHAMERIARSASKSFEAYGPGEEYRQYLEFLSKVLLVFADIDWEPLWVDPGMAMDPRDRD